jgi:7-cyano-7-deazaguanine synthase in queuosine biosynthesis
MAFTLYLRAPGETRRPPRQVDAVVHLDEPGLSGHPLHHRLDQFFISPEPPPESVASFLLTALAVWTADKLVPRRGTEDAWTRTISLSLPAAGAWVAQLPRLAELCTFLTGDVWTLIPRETPLHLGFQAPWPHAWLPQAVALFSGGLDSLAGAIDLLEAGQRLVLVSHYDFGQLASLQQRLAAGLAEHYGPDRLLHLGIRVQFPESPEITLRSRSLLYLALGLTAAAAFGPATPLIVPENGWISLNPPLTGSRLGPYSTRTTHPHFLEQLVSLWQAAGLAHPLGNPYQHFTKGEVLAQCRNRKLLKRLLPLTLSCARPEVARWQRQEAGACGYCYPCLIRRAASHRLRWDDGNDFRVDVLSDPEILRHRVKGSDLRAMLMALKTWEETPGELEARLWLGSPTAVLAQGRTAALDLLGRGFQEIAAWVKSKGGERLTSYLE